MNPAGIGGVARDSVDLSASAFVLRAYSVPGLMAYSTGERADGDLLEIVSVPSALTLVRRLGGRARLALGVFVPQASDVVLRSKLDVQAEPADAHADVVERVLHRDRVRLDEEHIEERHQPRLDRAGIVCAAHDVRADHLADLRTHEMARH